ncbi:hypothetical protein Mapa_000743 [Marchantia paleacea]|nr:hypothetical protein Mapa_000743 [Marchantia paleacea]
MSSKCPACDRKKSQIFVYCLFTRKKGMGNVWISSSKSGIRSLGSPGTTKMGRICGAIQILAVVGAPGPRLSFTFATGSWPVKALMLNRSVARARSLMALILPSFFSPASHPLKTSDSAA